MPSKKLKANYIMRKKGFEKSNPLNILIVYFISKINSLTMRYYLLLLKYQT